MLLKNLRIVTSTTLNDQTQNIRITDGLIAEIGPKLRAQDGEQVHDFQGAYVSPGWMDMHVHLREPGYEHKETIVQGCAAAAFGGFTAVACMPNKETPVDVHPIGCVTKHRKGESIAEMADMKKGGAVAFSDDGDPVYDAQVMRIALEYSSMLDAPIINHEEDLSLSRPGHMNEGAVSTRLGVDGTPGIAEEVMIARDILLAEYTGGHVHVAHISTAEGVDLVRKAKAKGIPVTTEVCPHHFHLTDEEVEKTNFSTNVKMHPPLRTQHDVDAMIEGLKDGTIDVICTDHAPHAIEEKEVEFNYAPNGIIGLETAWAITNERLFAPGHLSLTSLIDKLCDQPRKILRLEVPQIAPGSLANLTIFNTDERWVFDDKNVRSKSHNSPYLNRNMTGRAVAIVNKGQLQLNTLK
jgi:dihydroorotase